MEGGGGYGLKRFSPGSAKKGLVWQSWAPVFWAVVRRATPMATYRLIAPRPVGELPALGLPNRPFLGSIGRESVIRARNASLPAKDSATKRAGMMGGSLPIC